MKWLEALKTLASALSLVLVPIIVAVLGGYYAGVVKENETSGHFVELAVKILSDQPDPKNTQIRTWATKILDHYSGVPFTETTREDIINTVPLPQIDVSLLPSGFKAMAQPRTINRIIISDSQQNDLSAEIAGLSSNGVSFHYIVDLAGGIQRLVDENNVAFHVSGNNNDSIGIDLLHVHGDTYPAAQEAGLVTLLKDIVARRHLEAGAILARSEIDPRRLSDFSTIRTDVIAKVFQ